MDGAQTGKGGTIRSRGLKFPDDPDVLSPKLRRALRGDGYERKEAEAVTRLVRKDDRVLELGGGIGFMSTLIAKTRRIERIDVFEANPALIPYIEAVHALNDVTNATVHNAILGPRKGKTRFLVRRNILASSMDEVEGAPAQTEVEIEVRNAKATMRTLKPTLLVCDIEGAEAALIPAMDLSSLRAAIVELHPQWIGPDGVSAVFRAFMDAGLSYFAQGSHAKVVAFRRGWVVK